MANDRSSRPNRIAIWTAAVLVVVLVAYLAHLVTRTVLVVRSYTVVRGSIQSTVSTNGKVQPIVNFESHAPFPGLVKAIYVHEGDHVPAGKLLLTLDNADAQTHLAQAQASLAGALANEQALAQGGTLEERSSTSGRMDQARSEQQAAMQALSTLKQLQLGGAASAGEVAQAQARVGTDQSNLQVLEQQQAARQHSPNLAQAQAEVVEARAAVAAATSALANSNVRAPFAGTVYSISASLTEFVQQGDKLLQIADLKHMQVLAYFDEPDVGKLSLNQPVAITWVAKPNQTWHGRITRLPATIVNYTTRNVGEVYCSIDDGKDDLLPDTNVDVKVTTNDIANALFIPREALHTEQGLTYVYRIKADSLKRTPVTVGSINLTQVQIVSGVRAGDVVALGSVNGQPLINGTAVKVQ